VTSRSGAPARVLMDRRRGAARQAVDPVVAGGIPRAGRQRPGRPLGHDHAGQAVADGGGQELLGRLLAEAGHALVPGQLPGHLVEGPLEQ
jgi:hypothetical protein